MVPPGYLARFQMEAGRVDTNRGLRAIASPSTPHLCLFAPTPLDPSTVSIAMAVIEPARTALGATHEVSNQSVPLAGYNVFEQDRPLVEALEREGAEWAYERARTVGEIAGGEALEWGRQANENPPVLRTHDRFGNRIDEVEFHPVLAPAARCRGRARHCTRSPGPRTAPARMLRGRRSSWRWARPRRGHGCPISMTYSAVPALRAAPELAQDWEPLLTSLDLRPPARPGGRQGGSPVRDGDDGEAGRLGRAGQHHHGAPAQRRRPRRRVRDHRPQVVLLGPDVRCLPGAGPGPVGSLLLPAPAGAARRHAQPLPPSAAQGQARQPVQRLQRGRVPRRAGALVGEEGRGVPTIIEMVNHTRLDCVLGSTAPACARAWPRQRTTPRTAPPSASC